ncbi:Mrp/NBP35 family ATP-binding protein [Prosthecochloris sp. N3]|uniref:Iron-sulfur cluster carrier protein n=1 Tax=Prosthecochloris ethylica TaxID=2743976 RepID=A0ABR9XUQ0_9CHLB|nr:MULTISPECIES: Mrp/NBP35 family ATP-binding protein [Prosthecochloris]MEC9487309.1 Mrp/NBP35 family ATP-binding protein [Prosthecochloris sp.]MBF0587387.1 Mrp/NBP35 family ATP-binding protein [Prosthecochloris ethylica]MBF0637613.1 Mrp/NBP35 family ATP-binding protein [Prosthecochloris ethylica]NUK48640.1 Mrp/NBP35 family ATP-binding protein [Prosthecochloris ethylica]RNA65362.1 iron-sulfur cluster carrier protein ApbC [Prosthecochloris sp. ZM_2]
MPAIQKSAVLEALKTVMEPDLKKDLVSLNMVQDISIDEENNISFSVVLTTPACPMKDHIRQSCIAAVREHLPEAGEITVNLPSKVTSGGSCGHHGEKTNPLPGVRNIVAVASGKGGVGKSTVAVNLAVSLAKTGASVGLVDADLYGPSVPTMFGLENARPAVENKTIIPLEKYGVKLMSIGFLVESDSPVIWRGPMASTAIKQFITDVAWGELDYLIFDLPPGTGDIQLTLVQTLPVTGAVIVTTPQEVALMDVAKAVTMFRKVNVPILGLVENMSYYLLPDGSKDYIFGKGGGEKFARAQAIELLGSVPIGGVVREGGDSGMPVTIEHPDSEPSQAFLHAAQETARQISMRNACGCHGNC